jgi:hypothetical protein
LIMYLLKPVLQACSILAMRIGQTIAKLVFSVPKPLAMLPLLPPVVLVSPRLRRRNARDLRNWNLNVRLPRRWTLGISRPFREGAGEQDRHTCSKAEFRHSYSPVSTIADPRGDFTQHVPAVETRLHSTRFLGSATQTDLLTPPLHRNHCRPLPSAPAAPETPFEVENPGSAAQAGPQ